MMKNIFTVLVLLAITSCEKQDKTSAPCRFGSFNMNHSVVDFAKWSKMFPIETFEQREGPRKFSTTEKGDPLDLWKARGEIITGPSDLCHVELVRERAATKFDLGRKVPVDTFIWKYGDPDKPYLTKLGGVPHRERAQPWPTGKDGKSFTFVAQFCFLDSKDIVSDNIPNDVMLVFFKDSESHFGEPEDVYIEWSSKSLREPMSLDDCPEPQFPVPTLAGEIHRCYEYPDSWDVFEQEGHYQCYLFVCSQSTKIGRETFVIQNDPREHGQEFICALNSIQPSTKWPFTNMEDLPKDLMEDDEHYGWGSYQMMFGDVGCMYFMIDGSGSVEWYSDCY